MFNRSWLMPPAMVLAVSLRVPSSWVAAAEQSHAVRRPVIETAGRQEQYVLYEPVTAFVPQQVDQGAWVDQQVVRPGRTNIELRWLPGGWTVDPATGREYWRLPMLRPVRVRRPDTMELVRVWKPNIVTLSVPKVSYQPRLHTRQVPVQTPQFLDERRVRRWPCPCDRAAPVGTPPAFPAPPPSLLQPEIDPLEKVPDPPVLSPSKTGEQSGPMKRRDEQDQDRVAWRTARRNGFTPAATAAQASGTSRNRTA